MHPIPNRLKELAMVLLAGLVLVVPGASARDVGDQKIREFATALIGGLDSAKLSSVPTNGAFDEVSVKVAAYRPDDGDEPGLAEEVRAISLRLTAEMQARHGDRYRFMSDEAHRALQQELAGGGSGGGPADEVAVGARPDILIQPIVVKRSGRVRLTYQAIGVYGATILATTKPVSILQEPTAIVTVADTRPGIGADGIYRPVALEAERLLLAHGYDPGSVDGYIDDDLRRALRDYQSNSALRPSGRLTWETVENLRRDRRTPQ